MDNKEKLFAGMRLSGIPMLILNLLGYIAGVVLIVLCINYGANGMWPWYAGIGLLLEIISIIVSCGFVMLEPGEARVMMFFGKYRGTFSEPGYYWVNPFLSTKKLSLRARNLDAEPIKVNDKAGNPVMIGMVIVWKLKDTYKAMFEIDSQTMAGKDAAGAMTQATIMKAFEQFVRIQSDAALRQVAGQYAYDLGEDNADELTLRDGSDEINKGTGSKD